MKFILSSLFLSLFCVQVFSQEVNLVTPLSNSINETSGLIYLNNSIFTHNDSGDEAILYEISETTGEVLREIIISDIDHVDWEDICFDDSYIYIADMGNNNGSRMNLCIHKVLISDIFDLDKSDIASEAILFSYADQLDFTPNQQTNFDAEALISINDYLYIFTKNWGDRQSNIYRIPKSPGTYSLEKIKSINPEGLITGGTYNPASNTILLTGYNLIDPFIIEIGIYDNDDLDIASTHKYSLNLPFGYSPQVESITYINSTEYFISSEKLSFTESGLFKYKTNLATQSNIAKNEVGVILPTPLNPYIQIKESDPVLSKIYNVNGQLIKSSNTNTISCVTLSSGLYILKIKSKTQSKILTYKFVIP